MRHNILITCLLLLLLVVRSEGTLSEQQINELYTQANMHFRQGNTSEDFKEAKRHYEQAILSFEKIIKEGDIENVKLYYNLANTYFLNDQLGKAILHYRRAEMLDNSDEDLKKNLAFARSQRIDKIIVNAEKRILHTLFFWHYDFSIKVKFLLTCIFSGLVFLCLSGIIWFGLRKPWLMPAILFGILTLCFLISTVIDYQANINQISGVIVDKEVVARQGDGTNYPASFKEPLHEGTEFDLLEQRLGWFHIQLSDGSDGWINEDAAELIF